MTIVKELDTKFGSDVSGKPPVDRNRQSMARLFVGKKTQKTVDLAAKLTMSGENIRLTEKGKFKVRDITL